MSRISPEIEKQLLGKIARGDQFAFTLIYNAYHPLIYSFSRYLLHSDQLAADIVQESMLHIWQLGTGLENVNNLENYVKTFAKRRAIDLLRRRAVEHKAEKILGEKWSEEHNGTEEGILIAENLKILQDGIRLLPTQQRSVYELCKQEGLKYEEAAKLLGISSGTVKTHLKIAMRFLREYVGNRTGLPALLIIFNLL